MLQPPHYLPSLAMGPNESVAPIDRRDLLDEVLDDDTSKRRRLVNDSDARWCHVPGHDNDVENPAVEESIPGTLDATPRDQESLPHLEPASAEERPQEKQPCLRLIVFDFDQTLVTSHIFHSLVKLGASSEIGQMCRIQQVDARTETRSFSLRAIGGDARLEQVRQLLEDLRTVGVELVICTKGLVGTVSLILSELGLLSYFAEVYGNIGEMYGSTAFDEWATKKGLAPSHMALLGRSDQAAWSSKDVLVQRLLDEKDLLGTDVLFVDDDPAEIERVQEVSRTLWVEQAQGLTVEQFRQIREWSRVAAD